MKPSPTFRKEYKRRNGSTWVLSAYLPVEDGETIVLNNIASTKRKVYVEYPDCYIEILHPDMGIDAHHLKDTDSFKKFLYNWSGIWGANFWQELESRCLI